MREFIVRGFFVFSIGGDEFVVTKKELFSLLADGAPFDHIRPLHQEDFSNPILFQIDEVRNA